MVNCEGIRNIDLILTEAYMKIEEYGKENEKTIIMLHGVNFVHSFGRQYLLATNYHLVIPHLMGYGYEAGRTFEVEACVRELEEFITSLNKKVMLVGYSLGAQLAFKLVSEAEDLFCAAIIVSPWLIKEEPSLSKAVEMNVKQLGLFKKKWLCNIIGLMTGLPSSQRKEFVEQMQNVKSETIKNSVDNGITFETVPQFLTVSLPIIALAGEKEPKEIKDSVKKMSEINENCRYEIWDKAAHNIPPVFAKKFNQLICDTF
jgi:pimeloyl-ACP methyl ester carboxylesterase